MVTDSKACEAYNFEKQAAVNLVTSAQNDKSCYKYRGTFSNQGTLDS